MKINLKKKIFLTILAGNMACMGSAWADTYQGVVSGGKAGRPGSSSSTSYYTGTVDGTGTGEYATQNATITIADGTGTETHSYEFIYGGYGKSGSIDSITLNSIIITGGTAYLVYGGYSSSGLVTENKVTISGGSVSGSVKGGESSSGTVAGNQVEISGGSVGYVYGGYGGYFSGLVTENTVTISNGSVSGRVYGGYGDSSSGTVTENKVTISGGSVSGDVYGGYSSKGNVVGNQVEISGGMLGNLDDVACYFKAYGGYSSSGTATENKVTISGGTTVYVYGGSSLSGTVVGNQVEISGGLQGRVYGGSSYNGSVSENTVMVWDGSRETVCGGHSNSSGTVSSNSVTISGGTTLYVYGGESDESGIVSNNSVTISGGSVSSHVYGGYSDGSGLVTENKVTISGGSVSGVYGGESSSGTVVGNQVEISGGSVGSSVYGGRSSSGLVTENTVTISGGTVRYVYGGYSFDSGDILNNTVNYSGGKVDGGLYGGSTSGTISNNTLNISNGDLTAKEVGKFATINFYLPTIAGNKTMLSLTNAANLADVNVGVYLGENANSTINTYDVTLLNKATGTFDVKYYDKDENYTGYVEKFQNLSAEALIIGNGAEMHLTQNLTTDAEEILGKQDTLYVDTNVNLTLTGTELDKIIAGDGNLIFNSDISTDADNLANAGKKTINSGKTLTFIDGVVADKLDGAGNLKFATDMSVDADNLANTGTNTVESGKKVTFTSGNITQKWDGAGNLKFETDMSVDADNFVNTGINTVESGKKVTFTSGNITQNWDGAGTAEFNNTVSVTDGVNLGTATNNVNGTLDVAGNITANNINFKSGSTLKVDGSKITSTPAISGLTSASVESGSKLYIANAEKETEYKILDGSNLDVQSWTTDETATGINASYGLKIDTVTNDGAVFNIIFKEDTQATGSSDIKNILVNLSADGKIKEWVDNISTSQEDMKIQSNTINTMANMAQLANVHHGTYETNNFATENIFESMSSEHIPIIEHERPELKNTDASDEKAEIITIPTGQMQEELTREEIQQNYEKRVWATIIHSKEKIDGMETGHLEQNSTLQYNGTTVGADLWSGKHGFGGVAVTYADGNFASSQEVSNVKNDADFYGINVYNRQDIKKVSIQYDIGYTHTDNDVKMHTLGAEEVTAKPKVDAYSAGVKLEQPIKIGKMAKFIPFIGARYMFLKSKNYTNNLGLGYDTDDQHLFKIPIGVTLKGDYQTDEGWLLSTLISAGYTWNLGDRDGKQNVSYGGYSDIIDYSIADKGEYFVRAALQAEYEKLLFELGYRYTKGKTTRDNKWYLNMNCEF